MPPSSALALTAAVAIVTALAYIIGTSRSLFDSTTTTSFEERPSEVAAFDSARPPYPQADRPPPDHDADRRAAGFEACLRGSHSFSSDAPSFVTDEAILRRHHAELLDATSGLRPTFRSKRTVYKKYLGPRLEDHFIQRFIDEDYSLFSPAVPLFVHWTELGFGAKGTDTSPMKELLRSDVLYLVVTSTPHSFIKRILGGRVRHVIVASSKGCAECQIQMPHLFVYQATGFDAWGRELNATAHGAEVSASGGTLSQDPTRDNRRWSFDGYEDYLRAPHAWEYAEPSITGCGPSLVQFTTLKRTVSPGNFPKLTILSPTANKAPRRARFVFVGNLGTHLVRREADNILTEMSMGDENFYRKAEFDMCDLCEDHTIPAGVSPCWRVQMLQGDFNLCPVGKFPVSYRLYEALQQGSIPIYLYEDHNAQEDRKYYLPYEGTAADVAIPENGLGFVVSMGEFRSLLERLVQLTPTEIEHMRTRIMAVRDSHYTPLGAMEQLAQWLRNPGDLTKSDVRCRRPLGVVV